MPDFIHEAEGGLSILKSTEKTFATPSTKKSCQGLSDALVNLEASRELRAVVSRVRARRRSAQAAT